MKAILLGLVSALFFAITFVLNRSMELSGGSWIWSASLRYLFMLPMLLLLVLPQRKLFPLLHVMRERPGMWVLWSLVGFGLFYIPICMASAYSPGWLVAGTWQLTIICGSLLAPLFWVTVPGQGGLIRTRGMIPLKGLFMSLLILLGVVLMQLEQARTIPFSHLLWGTLPIIIAAFAYPLGNRKMMELTGGRLDALQRVLGMTLASLPLWVILSGFGIAAAGLPSREQVMQSVLVALFSGVVATVLFFKATDMAQGSMHKLGAVEATQSMEVLFALAGELIILNAPLPSLLSWIGMGIVIIGMVLHSTVPHKKPGPVSANERHVS
ncbi:multidrug resistance efflux transporter family protein [Paenibacillus sp. JX-17]|uniref:Multidrug resistance efflux transporter family protein n=1 Tax=Paenibacillus lacisoli TaxID=3064525 RepID=A0ABT9CFC0_9BACL|nr:multidrug resistance efflux transporter family protein [Paenibacillus sp. JX-17]MDO7907268.1 multidrug resistance efflux transporter family protein [Paenibacillus sp. JX-17]